MKMDNCWSRCIQFSSSSLSDVSSSLTDESESLIVNHQMNISNMSLNRNKHKNQSNNVKLLKTSLLSIDNTTSGVNWSNMSENEETTEEGKTHNSKGDSFDWNCDAVDRKMLGYQKNGEDPKLNKTILNNPSKRKIKPKFTPPIFSKTGIYICPDYEEKKEKEETRKVRPKHSRSHDERFDADEEDDPGNKEFQEFNYPKVGNSCTYISYVVPDREDDWDWIYNHIKQIKNSFRRKYRANVSLCKKAVPYKGRRVHMMKIESHNQFNILRCRNGLPNRLKQMIYDAPNAIFDTECYTSEYLIKRKKIFAKINENKPEENRSTERSSMADISAADKEAVPVVDPEPEPSTVPSKPKDMKSDHTGDGESKVTSNKNQVNQHQQPKSKSLTKTTEETRDSRKAKKMKQKVEKKKIKSEISKKREKK